MSGFDRFVLLVPLVSWAAPASVPESYLLGPSVRYCRQRLGFQPDIVVGDMGYIQQETKRLLRTQWQVAVLTKLKADMKAHCPWPTDQPLHCPQGQELVWQGYDAQEQRHWFVPPAAATLCAHCWQRSDCPREFAHAAAEHESFLGMIPLNTRVAQHLLRVVRSWIEPAQSFEKNQLGLKAMFLNSLRLCWTVCLLADSVALLRALALLREPARPEFLHELLPTQPLLALE